MDMPTWANLFILKNPFANSASDPVASNSGLSPQNPNKEMNRQENQ